MTGFLSYFSNAFIPVLKVTSSKDLEKEDVSLPNLLGAFIMFSTHIEEKALLRYYPERKKQVECFLPTVIFKNGI